MKRIATLFLLAISAMVNTANAQSYSLGSLTDEQFEAGGTTQWGFEWYDYSTHTYSTYASYGADSYVNYLDWYNPERLGGERITEIDDIVDSGSSYLYWASNRRNAWYNVTYADPQEGTTYERYCYVARDTREGFGYEIYGNKGRSSVVTFTVPADGFYQVDGSVVREDNGTGLPLMLVPRFRYATAEDQNTADVQNIMTTSILYGHINAGQYEGYTGKNTLADGAEQRFNAQEPIDFLFAFQAKEGDKVSFEVNCDSLSYTDNSANARDGWARTFLPKLDISAVTEEEAQATELYVDPYGEEGADAVEELVDSLAEVYELLDPQEGTTYGTWSLEAMEEIQTAMDEALEAVANNEVNNMNVNIYLANLREAWATFLSKMVTLDWSAEGNYRLYYTEDGTVVADTAALAKNDGDPWKFQAYIVDGGTYQDFTTYNSSNSNRSSCNTWYGLGTWLFIGEDGTIHPSTTKAPAIVFVAPADAVYNLQAEFHRTQFNTSAPVQLYMRSRFLASGTEQVDTASYIVSVPFGYPASTYSEPASMDYYVNLHAGDRITFELDCYTGGRNSSCLCMIDEFSITSRSYADGPLFTVDDVPSTAYLYDPYSLGDKTELTALVDSANVLVEQTAGQVGDGEGLYDADLLATLQSTLETANALIAADDAVQVDIDEQERLLGDAISAYADSRRPYELVIRGVHGIRIAGTDKHLTRKNLTSGGYFYAAWANEETVAADIEQYDNDATDYSWLFQFSEWNPDELDPEDIDSTFIGSTVVTNADTDQFIAYMANGYFVQGILDDAETTYNLRFYTQEANDTLFSIRRADGTYWGTSMTWSGGKNYVNSSDEPVYGFVVDDTYLSGSNLPSAIESVNSDAGDGSQSKQDDRTYNLMGQRVDARYRGIMIRNGQKVVVR